MRPLLTAIAVLVLASCAPPEWRAVCHVTPPACSNGGTVGGPDAPVPACVTFDRFGNVASVSSQSFTCDGTSPACAGEGEVPSCVQLAP